jgi:hypothetical protein
MFGDDSQQQLADNGMAAPAVGYGVADTGQMAQPIQQPAVSHQMTPAYPVVDDGSAMLQPTPPEEATTVSAPASHPEDHDLLAIKQDALNALSPLVGNLDQNPEEKFRTTMMLIQASDDRSLVKVAYEAAQAIPDEKSRAQALLDVINEINYFTSHTA